MLTCFLVLCVQLMDVELADLAAEHAMADPTIRSEEREAKASLEAAKAPRGVMLWPPARRWQGQQS